MELVLQVGEHRHPQSLGRRSFSLQPVEADAVDGIPALRWGDDLQQPGGFTVVGAHIMSQRQRGAFMPDESGLRIGDVGDERGKTFAGLSLRDGGDAGFVHAKRQTDTGRVELFRPFLLLLGGQ